MGDIIRPRSSNTVFMHLSLFLLLFFLLSYTVTSFSSRLFQRDNDISPSNSVSWRPSSRHLFHSHPRDSCWCQWPVPYSPARRITVSRRTCYLTRRAWVKEAHRNHENLWGFFLLLTPTFREERLATYPQNHMD